MIIFSKCRAINLFAFCYLTSLSNVAPSEVQIPIMLDNITIFDPLNRESAASKATVGGLDENNDGIRDDVMRAIENEYADNALLRNTTISMARVIQKIVIDGGALSHLQVIEMLKEIEQREYCLLENSEPQQAGKAFLYPLALNTYQRAKRYLQASADAIRDLGSFPAVSPACAQ